MTKAEKLHAKRLDALAAKRLAGARVKLAAAEAVRADLAFRAPGMSDPEPARPGDCGRGGADRDGTGCREGGGVNPVAVVEKPAPQVESDRAREHRLKADIARLTRETSEAREALTARRHVLIELSRSGVLINPEDAPKRTLRKPGPPRGQRLRDPEEILVAKADAETAALAAARELRTLVAQLQQAKVALAAYELEHGPLDRHGEACERVRVANERAEAAHIELIAALIEREEACAHEADRARPIIKAATGVLTNDDARADLRHRAGGEVPVRLNEDGSVAVWRQRPVSGLFDLDGADWQPRGESYFEAIADVVHGGRQRVGGTCGSERVADRIKRALGRN
jgi:hypothetical protein